MTHPFGNIRQHDVERSRVAHIAKGYATGGAVSSDSTPVDRKSGGRTGAPPKMMMSGGGAKMRGDRPGRAKGGRAPKAKTNVNVIIAPQGATPAAGVAAPPGLPPPKPAVPPLAGPPGMPMPPPGMGGPPGMPPRSMGGRTYATGGGVNSGTKVFNAGRAAGTQVSHATGKNDQKDVGRGKPITYATGGPVFAQSTGQHGPKFKGGGGGGEARLQKESRAARKYKKAT